MYIFPYNEQFARKHKVVNGLSNMVLLYLAFMSIPLITFFNLKISTITVIILILSEIFMLLILLNTIKSEKQEINKIKNTMLVFDPNNKVFYCMSFINFDIFGISGMSDVVSALENPESGQQLLIPLGETINNEILMYQNSNEEKYTDENIEIIMLHSMQIEKQNKKFYKCIYVCRDGSLDEIKIPKVYKGLNLSKYLSA